MSLWHKAFPEARTRWSLYSRRRIYWEKKKKSESQKHGFIVLTKNKQKEQKTLPLDLAISHFMKYILNLKNWQLKYWQQNLKHWQQKPKSLWMHGTKITQLPLQKLQLESGVCATQYSESTRKTNCSHHGREWHDEQRTDLAKTTSVYAEKHQASNHESKGAGTKRDTEMGENSGSCDELRMVCNRWGRGTEHQKWVLSTGGELPREGLQKSS